MKKSLLIMLCLLISFIFLSVNNIRIDAENNEEITVFDGASSYKVTQHLINEDIGYGINHIKDFAVSRSNRLNNYDSCGPIDTYVGQQINVLTIPSNETIRIVNWTFMTTDGWTKQTVRKLAENFEYYNPGWQVVAAINGDFFDINGNQALPYSMNGIGVSNGEVYKPYGSATNVGFKNDGSSNPLVGGHGCETGPLMLQVLDEFDNVVKEYPVNKTNEAVSNNEIGVWFSYYKIDSDGRSEVTISTPSTNTYYSHAPIRCLPMNKTTIYGKSKLIETNESINLKIGQFAVETTNEEIVNYINNDYVIRLQQEVVGKFEDCDNITGAGAHLLYDGEPVDNGARQDRHPRTVVGVKEDGSVVFMTVDGRQFEDDMYGMNYDELAAALLNYGCVEAYNLDGGGSTTFITRNQYGDFDVHNSPSDGGERNDSNALLVVVPEITFNIDHVSDTSLEFSYQNNDETIIDNLNIKIGDQDINAYESTVLVENLTPKTKYDLIYSYDIVYKNSRINNITNTLSFTTGNKKPIISNFYYEDDDENYIFYFNIDDPDKLTSSCYIKYDRSTYEINSTMKTVKIPKTKVKDPSTFTLNGRYDLKSSHSTAIKFQYPISTYQEYTINYELNGGTTDSEFIYNYNPSSEVIKLPVLEKYGYVFKGWYTQEEGGVKLSEIENTAYGNVTLHARWAVANYRIQYVLDGAQNHNNNPRSYNIFNTPITLYEPSKPNYTFVKWLYNNEPITEIPQNITGNIQITAIFEPITYSLTFELNDSTFDNNITSYTVEDLPIKFNTPIKKGYTFTGWNIDGDLVDELTIDNIGNAILTATFELISFNITYNLDGGINNSENVNSYTINDSTITLSNPTKEGYIFKGWSLNNSIVTNLSPSELLEDITLTATWEQIQTPKKGCGCKKSMNMIILPLSLIALGFIILKKKH